MLRETGPGTKAVIWQEGDGETSIGEPALLVSVYSDIFTLRQGAEGVNINYETIPDLLKMLRRLHKEHNAEAPE